MRRKLHVKKGKEESFSDKKRGFTLIELLAVIVIIGAIGGIAATAVVSIINNSKENATELAINNVKSAAELYSKENNKEIEWIKQYNEDGTETSKFVCMTVRQLINNGYFDEDFFEEDIYHDRLNDNTYIEIKQGINSDNTDVIIHEDANTLNDCETEAINSELSDIVYSNPNSFTDRLSFDVSPKNEVGDVTFFVTYEKDKVESDNIDCNNGTCLFERLEDNTGYKIKICMRPNEGNTTLKNTVCEYFGQATEAFTEPTIKIENANKWKKIKKVTITYDDTGIYNEKGIHYFKSEVNATFVSGKIYKCDNFENGKNNTCNSAITANGTITEGTWYKVEGEKVEFNVATHLGKGNSKVITARIQDQTGNYIDSKENITRIDTKAPDCISSGGSDSWIKGPAVLTGTCEDEDSGCQIKTITAEVSKTTSSSVSPGTVYDKAGNSATCDGRTVMIDNDPPDGCSVSGGNASWINATSSTQSRIITAKCTYDGESGCDNSKNPSYEYTKEIKTTTAGAEGNNNGGKVCDKVGNCRECPADQTVKIDRTKPNAWITAGADNYQLYGEYDKNDLSGIASATWSGGVNSSGTSNGSGDNATYTVIDEAGNSTPVTHATYKWCNQTVSENNVKAYKWGNFVEKDCKDKTTDKYRKYRFKVGYCHCQMDKYNILKYCNKTAYKDKTSISHSGSWNGNTSIATIYYKNSANGKSACKGDIAVNSYVKKVCENSGTIADDGTFYHGYIWYNGAVGPYNAFSSDAFYNNVQSSGILKLDSASNMSSACDLACDNRY